MPSVARLRVSGAITRRFGRSQLLTRERVEEVRHAGATPCGRGMVERCTNDPVPPRIPRPAGAQWPLMTYRLTAPLHLGVAAPLRAAPGRTGRVRPVRGARSSSCTSSAAATSPRATGPARPRRRGPTRAQRLPASQARPTRSSALQRGGQQVGDQALELAADHRDLDLDVAGDGLGRAVAVGGERRSSRSCRPACRGSPRPARRRRRRPSRPPAARSGSGRRRTSWRTTGCPWRAGSGRRGPVIPEPAAVDGHVVAHARASRRRPSRGRPGRPASRPRRRARRRRS